MTRSIHDVQVDLGALGKVLRAHRERCEMTLDYAARMLHWSGASALANIEHGRAGALLRTYEKLCNAYDVSLSGVFAEAERRNAPVPVAGSLLATIGVYAAAGGMYTAVAQRGGERLQTQAWSTKSGLLEHVAGWV